MGLEAALTAKLVQMTSTRMQQDTVLALDLSDIRKEYAQKMENLATVWNGSTGELHQGYWLLDVTAAEIQGSEIVPVCQKLFSVEAKEFRSENAEILTVVDQVNRHFEGRGIWTIDCGASRSCWNPCWTNICASSSAPPASARSATGGGGCAA